MRIILSVDDEFQVTGCAKNGKEALELAQKEKADVILMDIQMPEMDGIEATREIVKRKLGKVLILTTFDDDELVEKALKSGADGYLIKNHTFNNINEVFPFHFPVTIEWIFSDNFIINGHNHITYCFIFFYWRE
jgi:DNA-binding NarL/FixJ family response regulator